MRAVDAAGRLDHKITVQRRGDDGLDAFGHKRPNFSDLAVLWASYEPVSDGEAWRAGKVEGRSRARFQVRYSSLTAQIDEVDRLRFDNKIWSIVAQPKVLGRREWVEITAEVAK